MCSALHSPAQGEHDERKEERPEQALDHVQDFTPVGEDPVMRRLEDVHAQLEQIKTELARSRPGAAG
jgi:hypothetical protein